MNTEEEGNKLIANFDDNMKLDVSDPKERSWMRNVIGSNVEDEWFHLNSLKYHSSWGWLMPVVEKIEQGNYGFKMCRKVVEIYYDDTKELILKVKESSRLASLYKAVVDFIKWYNTQNK